MPAPKHSEFVVVGRLGAPYGVKGWINLQSFTTPAENLLSYLPWHLAKKSRGPWRSRSIVRCRGHKKGFVALLEGLANRDEAAALTGLLIGVPAAALPTLADLDEFYWRDLIGAQVTTVQGDELGEVEQLMETGANDVLVVNPIKKDGEEVGEQTLIPFADNYIKQVDVESGQIVVDWDPQW